MSGEIAHRPSGSQRRGILDGCHLESHKWQNARAIVHRQSWARVARHVFSTPQLLPLLDQIAVRRDGPGRPRKRPMRVLADKAYSHPSTRAALRRRGIAFTCPERRDQIAHRKTKGSHGGRPPAFDQQKYAGRNVVERCFNRLKQFRDLATRYAKRSAYYRAEITIAAIVLWLREDPRDTP
jgi:transposase